MKTDVLELLQSKMFTSANEAEPAIANWKNTGQKIVFTNGVFDLLHIGHISYLAKAAMEGDRLIIGLNSDASVKRIKGDSRPVNDQITRSMLLASLFFVDAVIRFDEDTPLDLIRGVKPDVLVKGADYALQNIVGAEEVKANGGIIKTVEFIDGYSSSLLIEKIQGI